MYPKRHVEYDFERLEVYQEAYQLTEGVYRLTKDYPRGEQYGMVSQLRRAAMSVVLNIAEGKGRHHNKVFVQFLYQARGSLFETMTLLKLSCSLGVTQEADVEVLLCRADKTSAYLHNLIKYLLNDS
jgi:four helix bundle protein